MNRFKINYIRINWDKMVLESVSFSSRQNVSSTRWEAAGNPQTRGGSCLPGLVGP